MLSFALIANAQQKLQKLSQSIKTDKDVNIDLNTSHTNIIIDTWNKGSVEIEAYIESDALNNSELQDILDKWDVNVDGTNQEVIIKTNGGANYNFDLNFDFAELEALDALKDLKIELAEIPKIPELPEMPEITEMTQMPK